MEGTAGTTAGSDGEVANAVLLAPLLVGTCNGVLETGGVSGVTGDGNANVFFYIIQILYTKSLKMSTVFWHFIKTVPSVGETCF